MSVDDFSDIFDPPRLAELYHVQIAKSRSVGRDGIRHSEFAKVLLDECELIHRKAIAGSYQFTAYREKLISRGASRNPRQISVPTVRDRLTLRAVCNALKSAFPAANSQPPHVYVRDCAVAMRSTREHSSFLRMDIKDFYPSIGHEMLLDMLREGPLPEFIVGLTEKAIGTPTGSSSQEATKVARGVPQGLSISNVLAAIYLSKFDEEMTGDFFYRRYVDDILFIAPSEKIKAIYTNAHNALATYKLNSHPLGTAGKTEETRLEDGAQYLGYVLTPKKISVRPGSVARMFKNISRVITQIKYRKVNDKDVFRLNLKISGCLVNGTRRGWMMFFSQTEDMSQLKFLDRFIDKEFERLKINRNESGVKHFIKVYHEIRYNIKATSYIPNFDIYDIDERIALISLMTGEDIAVLQTRSREMIEVEFSKILTREIADLEKDVLEAFS